MTAAAGYIRESTIAQGDRYGPDAQRAAIARAAADLDLELVAEYSDLISGTGALRRSDFQRMVTDARAGRFTVLVVYDTSRFARNEADAFTYEATLRAAGARVYYVREGIWSDDRRGALQKGVMHVINAQYSRDLSERIRDGYGAKWARLGLPGGTLPWGYRWTDGTATAIALIDEEAAIRRELLELYATGAHSAKALSDELNRRGHRLRGRAFDETVVYEVLRNPIAIGVTRRKGEERTGIAPALIDRRTWDAVQRIRRERHGRRGAPAQRGAYLFTSRARHAVCGLPLWGRRSARPTGVENRLQHSRPGCGIPFQRSESAVEAEFVAWLGTWQLDADLHSRLRKFLAKRPAGAQNTGETTGRCHRILAKRPAGAQNTGGPRRTAEARLERARRLYLLGDLDDDAYAAEKRAGRAVLDELVDAKTVLASNRDIEQLLDIPRAWPDMTLETRRAILEHLTTEIRFGDRAMELVIRPSLRRTIAAIATPVCKVDPAGVRSGLHTVRVDELTAAEHARWLEAIA
jgi:DNA invertase Pin-like site-specific DNA recombinase